MTCGDGPHVLQGKLCTRFHMATFKNLSSLGVSRKNIHDDQRRLLKYSIPFLASYLFKARFSSYISTETMYHNSWNAEADLSI